MYYFVTVLLGLFAVGCDCSEKEVIDLPPGTLQAGLNCVVETDVNPELLPQLGNAKLYKENDDNTNLHKFLHCVFSKFHYIKKNGHIKVDKAIDVFSNSKNKETLKKLMEDCNKESGKDGPETVYKIFGCFVQGSPVKFQL